VSRKVHGEQGYEQAQKKETPADHAGEALGNAKDQALTFDYLGKNVKVAAAQQSNGAALTRRNGNETISSTRLRSGRQFRSDHRPELSGAGTRARRRTLS
jgi:hypothetical protein